VVAVASLLAVALNHGRMGFMVEYCMLIQDLLQEVTVGGKMVWGIGIVWIQEYVRWISVSWLLTA
jgi:hypothetical protein